MGPKTNDSSTRRTAALVLLTVALVITGLAALTAPGMAEAPAPNPGTANFETKFMTDMIDHHAMAVHMAEMCVEKAIHEELRTTCEAIIATQSQEIELMQSWLSRWYGITYEPQMKPGAMRQMEKMMAMSSEEFEIAFMEEMIRHHEGAIREAEQCLKRAYHEDLIDLCQNIIETQSAEIAEMEAWLCEWYSICK
jgi:uncharacterized protein (DUF305 family)